MKRIDKRTVELTDREMVASERFEDLLSDGAGIPEAALAILQGMDTPDPAFVAWLSDGTVVRGANGLEVGPVFLHIHQGGTTNTYCGAPLLEGQAVGWEAAAEATCNACRSAYGV